MAARVASAPMHAATSSYRLPPHVSACRRGSNVVLLDIRRDRYLGINDAELPFMEALITGWPGRESADATPHGTSQTSENAARELADSLRARGLLIGDTPHGAPIVPPRNLPPTQALIDAYDGPRAKVNIGDLVGVVAAVLSARAQLRWRTLEAVAKQYRKRHQRHAALPFDIERAREHLAAFKRLRSLLFTTSDACLFTSLASAEFLARHRLFPDWVFGVRTEPFAAHCWLQHGTWVLNDTPESVSVYTPILVL